MDEPDGPDEESVDISLTLTQASSLYIIAERGIKLIEVALESSEQMTKDLKELNEFIKEDAKWLKQEATNIIQELSLSEEPKKSPIILPPNWHNEN